ncbi:Intramolecular chaperone auto-processing domain containing protein [uncultured Caudovirales phage]|uniref:Intramolecular chaperone auto-processing domain containing protein n=1 Tax=uncultured Caudovirales phage TaxID=2100421 RepID=A0A6J5QFQ2_9CAUD|nr:Intramolecular chaperone auto-processing domain containing protein [uncultured Caudovirales phage]CAB4214198.1 Intramolecular chaperone auto-processing domain containing protein [uncultured Caudovirales phage]CAB5229402.1 Intramolecular chaperone auto-processing domain containing protein [uncultured Caudovirales phage]
MASTISAGTTSGTAIAFSGDTSGSLQLQTNGTTTAVTIDTSQNVGIGNTTPSSFDSTGKPLVVGSGSGNQGITIYAGTTGYSTVNFADGTTGSDRYAGQVSYDHTNNALLFATTTGTERMRIDSNGRWMLNATTPLNTTARGSIKFDSTTEQGLFIATSSANNGQCMGFNYNTSTNVGSINITASATSYATSSDYRLKEDVATMIGALNTVAQLKPVTYKWKSDGSDGQGFIAHELAEVVPDCVSGEKDAVDDEGKPKYQGIDTSFLVATLTAAIQEAHALIIQLQADVAALKGVK